MKVYPITSALALLLVLAAAIPTLAGTPQTSDPSQPLHRGGTIRR